MRNEAVGDERAPTGIDESLRHLQAANAANAQSNKRRARLP